MKRLTLVTLVVALVALAIGLWPVAKGSSVELLQGKTIRQWHRIAVHRRLERDRARSSVGRATRQIRRLHRQYLHRPDSVEALRLAGIAYGVSVAVLLRRAICESKLNAHAENARSSASGLLQFLDGTWASTPYRAESVFSPYANALAGAWMESVGRGNEWACR